jgi:hypothetical protein
MSTESDIRKLLKMRADLEDRVQQLQIEVNDLNMAISELDKAIVTQGFRQPGQNSASGFQAMKMPEVKQAEKPVAKPVDTVSVEPVTDGSSIQAKDGTILGRVHLADETIVFTPREGLNFTTSTPPFQSFLIDRVLANMKTTDEARAATGEIIPEQVLSYDIVAEGEVIKGLTIRNYGGERRLREIQSSLRWSLDKMYDKMRRG